MLNCPNQNKPFEKNGFTVIEIIIVLMFFSLLTGLITLNLLNVKHRSTVNSQVMTLISDLKTQQLKAMVGDSEGRTSNDNYGIFFETNKYTLFHGTTYLATESSNFTVDLGDNMSVSNITLPGSKIVFSKLSGELTGFVSGANTFTIKNVLSGDQKIFTLNRFGVITTIN
jgi:type II secretory pathway pseudopilin PulG